MTSLGQMRSSRYLTLGAAVIMIFVLTAAMGTEAIRLDTETRASVSSSAAITQMATDKSEATVAKDPASSSISETKRSVHVGENEVREVAHKLPEFHEDYYGPSDHSPRHH